jgi:D-alanine-D-alanine ligase-like ATP-grasp enzyme
LDAIWIASPASATLSVVVSISSIFQLKRYGAEGACEACGSFVLESRANIRTGCRYSGIDQAVLVKGTPMSYDSDLVALFEEIAPAVGATVKIEPNYRRTGMLQFNNGAVLFFRNNHLNVNVASNARMAADKSFLSSFLAGMGFHVLPEVTVSRYDLDRGEVGPLKLDQVLKFAALNGWRTIVKPNAMSQGQGIRVTLDRQQLLGAISDTLEIDRVCIVQQYCTMPEYRLVVLNGSLLQAYRRQPMIVKGDGSSAIAELVRQKIEALARNRSEDNATEFFTTATRIVTARGRSMTDIAFAGEEIVVAETGNLAAGAEAIDVMQLLHPGWSAVAADLAKRCGLLLCGVDIFINDISDGNSDYRVIELNSAPGLDDYLLRGKAQRARVLALYQKVLETAAAALSANTAS